MKISEGSTRRKRPEGSRQAGGWVGQKSKGETRAGLLNILCPGLAREYRVPPKSWYIGIYLFIDIAHFPLSRELYRGLSLSRLFYTSSRSLCRPPVIISGVTICTSVLYIYLERARALLVALSSLSSLPPPAYPLGMFSVLVVAPWPIFPTR